VTATSTDAGGTSVVTTSGAAESGGTLASGADTTVSATVGAEAIVGDDAVTPDDTGVESWDSLDVSVDALRADPETTAAATTTPNATVPTTTKARKLLPAFTGVGAWRSVVESFLEDLATRGVIAPTGGSASSVAGNPE
jgi:hypothetical protein